MDHQIGMHFDFVRSYWREMERKTFIPDTPTFSTAMLHIRTEIGSLDSEFTTPGI